MKKYLLILTAILLSVVTGCKQTENDKKLSIELSLDQESVTANGAVINVKQENATKGAYLLTNDLQATITIEDVFAKGTELKSSDTKINLNGLKANTDYKVVAAISAEGQQLLSNEVKFKTQELPAEAPVIKFKQLDVTENSALIEVTTEKATKAFILCEPKGMTANADEEYIRKNGDEIPSEMLNKSFEATYEALSSETTYVIYSVVENESIAIVGETFEFTTLEEISSEEPYIKFELVEVTNSTVEYKVITKNVTSVKLLTQGAEASAPSEAIIDAAGAAIPSEYLNATYTVSIDELDAETEYAVYALVKGENDKFVSDPFTYKTLANSAGGDIDVTLTTAKANVYTYDTHSAFYTVFRNSDESEKVILCFRAENGSTYLPAGTYTLSEDAVSGTLDGSLCYYVQYLEVGSDEYTYSEATAEVTVDTETGIYNITLNGKLNDGSSIKATYEGEISGMYFGGSNTYEYEALSEYSWRYSVNSGAGTNVNLCLYSTEDQSFPYAKISFYVEGNVKYIPAGTYNIAGAEYGNVNASESSFFANEDVAIAFKEGTVDVKLEEKVYTITVDATLASGEPLKITYTGEIKEFTIPGPAETIEVTFVEAAKRYGSGKEYEVGLSDETKNHLIVFDFIWKEGDYVPAGSWSTDNTLDHFLVSSYCGYWGADNQKQSFSSIDLTTEIKNGKYEVNFTITTETNLTIIGTYVGDFPGITLPDDGGGEEPVEEPIEYVNTVTDFFNQNDGETFVKFTDANGQNALELDFFWYSGESYLPKGEYSFANNYLNKNFCYFDNLELQDAVINVDIVEGEYVIEMSFTTNSGDEKKGTFKGQIDKITLPEDGGNAVVFTKAECNPWTSSDYTSFSLVLKNDNDNRLDIALYGSVSDEVIAPGTYVAEADAYQAGKVNASNSYYYEVASSWQGSYFTSGEVTVSLNEETHVYTIAVEAELANGNSLSAVYEGEIDGLYFYPADEPDHYQFAAQAAIGSYQDWDTQKTPVTIQLFENPYNEDEWSANFPYVSLELNTEGGATHLLPGTYTLTNNYGVIGEGSLQSSRFYNRDQHGTSFAEGTLEVAVDENREYTLSLTGTLTNGRTVAITYSGAVSGLIVPGPAITTEVTFDNILVNVSYGYNFFVTLTTSDGLHKVELCLYDLNSSSDNVQLHPGFYDYEVWDGTQGYDYISGWASGYYYNGGEKESFKKGVGGLTVSQDGDNYTFDFELTVVDNETIKGTYTGPVTFNIQ